MKKKLKDQVIQEMRIRNYSKRTISIYTTLLDLLSEYFGKLVNQFKFSMIFHFLSPFG